MSFLERAVGRLAAIGVFAGTCCAIFLLMYVLTLVTQTFESPSFLAMPLIGAFVAAPFAIVGFALGAPFLGRRYAVWRCIALAFLPMMAGSVLAHPLANLSPRSTSEMAVNVTIALIFIVSAGIPFLAKKHADQR